MTEADTLPSASLSFLDIAFRRGDRYLFENLSFTLHPGQLLWVTGENGIGKTSILKLAMGVWRPESGTIERRLSNVVCAAKDQCAYLGHIDAFEPLLTAKESLDFWCDLYEFDDPIDSVFDRIGLTLQKNIRTGALSAGQKRRLAFGRLLIANRPIWVLDEPKAAMDKRGRDLIEELIAEHLARDGAALVATHDDTLSLGRSDRRIRLETPQ